MEATTPPTEALPKNLRPLKGKTHAVIATRSIAHAEAALAWSIENNRGIAKAEAELAEAHAGTEQTTTMHKSLAHAEKALATAVGGWVASARIIAIAGAI